MKKSILLMVALCSVSLMAEPVRLGGLGPDTMIETRGMTAQGVTNIVDVALASIDSIVESDPVAFPVATNALALAEGALTTEADTLATVTARGATTTNAVTIGNRGTGDVGSMSFAQGRFTTASGYGSHAEGYSTAASGDYSHAEGFYTTASGDYSHAEGAYTTASGDGSHAEGRGTTASGRYSHASGSKAYIPVTDYGAFAWQGTDGEYSGSQYNSHGPGTFNLNPVGGLAGFWIGEETLASLLNAKATYHAATNIAAAAVAASPVWLDRTGLSGTVEFVNDAGRPQAWSGTGALTVSGFTGLQSPAQVYWTLYGFDSVTLPASTYVVGGGAWQTNMVNHFTVWQVGTNVMLNFITATEVD